MSGNHWIVLPSGQPLTARNKVVSGAFSKATGEIDKDRFVQKILRFLKSLYDSLDYEMQRYLYIQVDMVLLLSNLPG